ncbi:hypothetical protein [Bifidobacterium catulorum]|uniref:hypothetical protein n=1 Tax=Bifidobacterium catulorum TaxID=1630173 RepID=UPI001475F39A|nr:hypothetical protein [Bifidobacterium catulorum]
MVIGNNGTRRQIPQQRSMTLFNGVFADAVSIDAVFMNAVFMNVSLRWFVGADIGVAACRWTSSGDSPRVFAWHCKPCRHCNGHALLTHPSVRWRASLRTL